MSEEEEGEGRKAGASVLVFFQGKGGVCFVFKKDESGGRARFRPVEKNKFRVLFFFPGCPKIFSLKIVLCKFSPPLSIWLDVHLYRKSLHVLFKEILQ